MLRHEPHAGEASPEIAGHLHPAGKVRLSGRAVRRRCFVSDGRRCVMPAFGAYAGGLNVLEDGRSRPLFGGRFHGAYARRIPGLRHFSGAALPVKPRVFAPQAVERQEGERQDQHDHHDAP